VAPDELLVLCAEQVLKRHLGMQRDDLPGSVLRIEQQRQLDEPVTRPLHCRYWLPQFGAHLF
jgi:hypothetical protein